MKTLTRALVAMCVGAIAGVTTGAEPPRATDQALVIAAMVSHLDRATTIPYDSLNALPGCDTTASGNMRVIGCTTVTASGARTSDVRIVVSTTVPGGHPDTVAFTRGKSRSPIPLR